MVTSVAVSSEIDHRSALRSDQQFVADAAGDASIDQVAERPSDGGPQQRGSSLARMTGETKPQLFVAENSTNQPRRSRALSQQFRIVIELQREQFDIE